MERGEVQLAYEERLAEVQVDRAVVHRRIGAGAIHQPEHAAARGVDDREGIGVCRPQRDLRRRVLGARPDDPRGRRLQLRVDARCRKRLGPEQRRVVVGERRFVGGRADVPGEHARVRVVEDRRLDASPEQLVRLAHEELVEPVLARDEHGETVPASSGAAPLLAQGRNGAGEADRDHRVEEADVDPELERVRRRDAQEVAFGEAALDLAPLRGGVARTVRREMRVVTEPLGGEAVDQLGRLAALREREGAQPAFDEQRLEA